MKEEIALDLVKKILSLYEEKFGRWDERQLELDSPGIVWKHLRGGEFSSYRLGSRWSDDSKLNFREAPQARKGFEVDVCLQIHWDEYKGEGELKEKEFYEELKVLLDS
jgi:hypothetical protein